MAPSLPTMRFDEPPLREICLRTYDWSGVGFFPAAFSSAAMNLPLTQIKKSGTPRFWLAAPTVLMNQMFSFFIRSLM